LHEAAWEKDRYPAGEHSIIFLFVGHHAQVRQSPSPPMPSLGLPCCCINRRSSGNKPGSDAPVKGQLQQFWERWTAERPPHPRWSMPWYALSTFPRTRRSRVLARPFRWWDMVIIFTVFGITGSSTMFFVRPFITKFLKLEGTTPHPTRRPYAFVDGEST
jgi:hypothetical protein